MARRLRALLVTEPEGGLDEVFKTVTLALKGGLDAVVVRRPGETAARVFELARRLRAATRGTDCRLFVNDRADVAVAADADGVHLGARSLPLPAARRATRAGMLLGKSVHNLDELGQAEEEGADYAFLGPIFATPSHPERACGLGLDLYREAALVSRIPVIAIGGVTSGNVRLIAQAGGPGAAAITAFSRVSDPAATARAFRAAFPS